MNRSERRREAGNKQKRAGGGKRRQAASLFREAVSLHNAGRADEAERAYRQVLRLDPKNPDALYNLGNVMLMGGRWEDAIPWYQKARGSRSGFADAEFNLANVYKELGRHREAEEGFRRTIAIDANHAGAHFNLGFVLSELGQLEEAREAFRNVIRLLPDSADAHRQLSSITRHTGYDDEIRAMETLYNKPGISAEQRQDAGFGLAKAFEDLKEYSKSFGYLAEANNLKRRKYRYSTDEQRRYMDRIKRTYTRGLFAGRSGKHDDNTPIFVLGMPRSGTSLVEQILASHPDVHGAGELPLLSQLARERVAPLASPDYRERVLECEPEDFAALGRDYVAAVRGLSAEARHITDKMPQNFLHIGLIRLALPNARIIHCRRDPMDNCLSIFKTYFPGNVHEYSCDQTELGEYYKLYQNLMEHWRQVLPGHIHDIRYEDLIADQEALSRALIDFCGLEWNDACIDFHKTERAVRTASLTQVRRPIYATSVRLWKQYEAELRPLAKALGIN